jgi:hypothetical protein
MKSVASRCNFVACNAHPLALHAVAHPFRGATENATQQGYPGGGQAVVNVASGKPPRRPSSGNGRSKPGHIPLAPLYEGTDRQARRYFSGWLTLPRRRVVLTEEVGEADPAWEAALVEGQHIKAHCEPVPSEAVPVVFGVR